jgi:hypothetical protein
VPPGGGHHRFQENQAAGKYYLRISS